MTEHNEGRNPNGTFGSGNQFASKKSKVRRAELDQEFLDFMRNAPIKPYQRLYQFMTSHLTTNEDGSPAEVIPYEIQYKSAAKLFDGIHKTQEFAIPDDIPESLEDLEASLVNILNQVDPAYTATEDEDDTDKTDSETD